MFEGICARIIQGCLMLLIPLSLGGAFNLTWKEYVRLGIITGGMLYLYLRYRDVLVRPKTARSGSNAAGGSARISVDRARIFRYASIVMALLFMFLITQFDPATGAIHAIVPQREVNWFFVGSTGLVVGAFGAYLLRTFRSKAERFSFLQSLSALDKLVLSVGTFVIVLSVASRTVLTSEPFSVGGLTGNVKVLGYVMLWFVVTRTYGPVHAAREQIDQDEHNSGDSRIHSRWRMSVLSIFFVFSATVLVGIYRTGSAVYFYKQGKRFFTAGEYDAAIRWYERSRGINRTLDLDSVREGYLEDMAYVYLKKGEAERAEESVNEMKARARWDVGVLRKIGDIYYRMGIWDKAIPEYQQYLKREAQDKTVLSRLASAYVKVLDTRGVLSLAEDYKYVPEVEAEGYEQGVFLGNVYLALREYDRALEAFSQAAKTRPEDAYAVYKMGRTLLAREDFERAIGKFRKAVELDSEFADAHYRLGVCLEELGRREEALREYERTVEVLPNHLDGLLALERMYSAR